MLTICEVLEDLKSKNRSTQQDHLQHQHWSIEALQAIWHKIYENRSNNITFFAVKPWSILHISSIYRAFGKLLSKTKLRWIHVLDYTYHRILFYPIGLILFHKLFTWHIWSVLVGLLKMNYSGWINLYLWSIGHGFIQVLLIYFAIFFETS